MIEMDNNQWNEKIKNNFNDAAYRYLEYSNIQKFFAEKMVHFIKELNPQKKGEWIDLGSGPGLLADEIEKKFSSQKVSRIDFSKKMLLENKLSRKKILWDLNNDLPSEIIVKELNKKGIRTHIRKSDHYSGNILEPLGLKNCVRVSMCHYNTEEEVLQFLTSMNEIVHL